MCVYGVRQARMQYICAWVCGRVARGVVRACGSGCKPHARGDDALPPVLELEMTHFVSVRVIESELHARGDDALGRGDRLLDSRPIRPGVGVAVQQELVGVEIACQPGVPVQQLPVLSVQLHLIPQKVEILLDEPSVGPHEHRSQLEPHLLKVRDLSLAEVNASQLEPHAGVLAPLMLDEEVEIVVNPSTHAGGVPAKRREGERGPAARDVRRELQGARYMSAATK